jgi:hypothetical protein
VVTIAITHNQFKCVLSRVRNSNVYAATFHASHFICTAADPGLEIGGPLNIFSLDMLLEIGDTLSSAKVR